MVDLGRSCPALAAGSRVGSLRRPSLRYQDYRAAGARRVPRPFCIRGAAGFFWNFIHQTYLVERDYAFNLVSAGTIPLANIAIGLKVGMSLFLVLLVLSIFRPESSQGKPE